MRLFKESIIYPNPDNQLLSEMENEWELKLPEDYKYFIMRYNGAEPVEKSFECNGDSYSITRFLCILDDPESSNDGWYDINVVESQIGERLTDNEDLVGIKCCL